MAVVLPLLGALFFVFLLAQAFGWATRRLGLPALIGEIIAGIVIANFVVGSFDLENWIGLNASSAQGVVSRDALTGLADIGVIFLAFAVGLEVLPSAVRRFARAAASTAAWGTTIPFALGVALVIALGGTGSWSAALFVGVALMVSSLTVTARILRDHGLLETDEAHLMLGAALIEDVVGAMVLTVVFAFTAQSVHGPVDLVYQAGIVLAAAIAFIVFFFYIAPRFVRRYAPSDPSAAPARPASAPVFVLAILLCLGASALATSFQLASIVGALLAGMAMAEVRDRYDLRSGFGALNTFFAPFFFAGIGLLVSVNELVATWPLVAALTGLAVVGKLVSVPAESRHHGRRSALRVGAGLVPRGEIGIIVAVTALGAGLITGDYYTAIVVMSIATSAIGAALVLYLFRDAPGPGDRGTAGPDAGGAVRGPGRPSGPA